MENLLNAENPIIDHKTTRKSVQPGYSIYPSGLFPLDSDIETFVHSDFEDIDLSDFEFFESDIDKNPLVHDNNFQMIHQPFVHERHMVGLRDMERVRQIIGQEEFVLDLLRPFVRFSFEEISNMCRLMTFTECHVHAIFYYCIRLCEDGLLQIIGNMSRVPCVAENAILLYVKKCGQLGNGKLHTDSGTTSLLQGNYYLRKCYSSLKREGELKKNKNVYWLEKIVGDGKKPQALWNSIKLITNVRRKINLK